MRVALCISGFLRTYDKNFKYLKQYLLDRYNVDIFIFTWNKLDRHDNRWNFEKVNNLYKPKNIVIHPGKSFDLSIYNNIDVHRDTHGILSMYYGIFEANNLKCDYENKFNFTYDCVIRFRADLKLTDNIIINQNNFESITLPSHGSYSGFNDQFAYSSSQNMNIYSNCFNNIANFSNEIVMSPEIILKNHLDNNNINVLQEDFKYFIHWLNGTLYDNKTRHQ